jgi:hypothetical protein
MEARFSGNVDGCAGWTAVHGGTAEGLGAAFANFNLPEGFQFFNITSPTGTTDFTSLVKLFDLDGYIDHHGLDPCYSSVEHPRRANDFRTQPDTGYDTFADGTSCEAIVTVVMWYRAFGIPCEGENGDATERNQNRALSNTAIAGAVDPLLQAAMHDDFRGIQTAITGFSHHGDACAAEERNGRPDCVEQERRMTP